MMSFAEFPAMATLGGMKSLGSFILNRRQAKADKAWQKYNNALTRMQNAQNHNAITVNEGLLAERTTRAKFAVRQAAYRTQGEAEMSAAAVGATGNNVERVLATLKKNESRELTQLDRDFEAQALQLAEQRTASNLQTEMQIDYKQIPSPNLLSTLLTGVGDVSMKFWESKLK